MVFVLRELHAGGGTTLVLEGWFHKAKANEQPNLSGGRLPAPRSGQELATLSRGAQPSRPAPWPCQLGGQSRLQDRAQSTHENERPAGVSGSFLPADQFLHPFCVTNQKNWEEV